MKQIHLVKVDTQALVPGMWIAELDCDWIDSPFLMQGFQLTEIKDLDQLQALCEFVYVDTRRSDADSVRLLLETNPPILDQKPDVPLQRVQRATASFVDKPVETPTRGGVLTPPGESGSLLGTMGAIVNETLRAGGAAAGTAGPTVSTLDVKTGGDRSLRGAQAWRDQGFGVGRVGEAAMQDDAPRLGYVATVDNDKPSFAPNRRSFSGARPRWRGAALDESADQANLRGPVLIESREKEIVATAQLNRAREVLDDTSEMMRGFFADLQAGRDIDFDGAHRQIAEVAVTINDNPEALKLLASLKHYDDYAYKHAIECLLKIMEFAQYQGFASEAMQTLGFVGMLLDVGMTRVPEDIHHYLHDDLIHDEAEYRAAYPPLRPEDRDLLRRHVIHSISLIGDHPSITPEVKEIVAQHHERPDGSGYPRGLTKLEIDKRASMARIVDVYTTLVSDRPHHKASTPSQAFIKLRAKAINDSSFDEQLLEDFIQSTGSFAVGCLVELNTGEVGIVVRVNRAKRLQPVVLLVLDHLKQPYAYPTQLDLMNAPDAPIGGKYAILRDVPAGTYQFDAGDLFFGGLG